MAAATEALRRVGRAVPEEREDAVSELAKRGAPPGAPAVASVPAPAAPRAPKAHVATLQAYVPGETPEQLERRLGIAAAVKLASNENPLGPSPRALEAARRAAAVVHRYPDAHCTELRSALARRLGVGGEQLVFGCGSDEILELLAKAYLGPGAAAVFAWPSFAMYPIVTQGMGATAVAVPLDERFVHDLPALGRAIDARTRLVMVCNPNNPTGTSVGAAAFDRFAASLPEEVILVVDEAYCEYARRPDYPDALAWVARRPGTITLRTFSKLYGLAGLRVGYGVGDPELIAILERVRHPFNVNSPAQAAALAALDDADHIERSRRCNGEGIAYLERELGQLGIPTAETDANFVLAQIGAGTAEQLLRRGVIVRPLGGFGLGEHARITVGLPEENERLVRALREVLGVRVP